MFNLRGTYWWRGGALWNVLKMSNSQADAWGDSVDFNKEMWLPQLKWLISSHDIERSDKMSIKRWLWSDFFYSIHIVNESLHCQLTRHAKTRPHLGIHTKSNESTLILPFLKKSKSLIWLTLSSTLTSTEGMRKPSGANDEWIRGRALGLGLGCSCVIGR